MSGKLNPQRIAQIQSILQSRDTDNLLEIWRAHDTNEWSPEAFEAIHTILTERLGTPPSRVESEAERLARVEQILERVNHYLERGELERALAECDLAIHLAPESAVAHNYRGLALDALGRLPEAIRAYREAVRLDPQFADAQENLQQAESDWAEGVALSEPGAETETAAEMETALADPLAEWAVEGGDIPETFYLSKTAQMVPGWPGYRNRPNRSGYDWLDTRFEAAYIGGWLLRQLFTRPIDNPLLLVFAGVLALLGLMPLIFGVVELLHEGPVGIFLLTSLSCFWIPGLVLLGNVIRSYWKLL